MDSPSEKCRDADGLAQVGGRVVCILVAHSHHLKLHPNIS